MIDLHAHSTASDGTLAPGELVQLAHDKGLEALALTDHDTVGGLVEASAGAARLGLRFVPGLELSAKWNGLSEVHVLGYCVNAECGRLSEALRWLRSCRRQRAEEIVEKLNRLGVSLEFDRVLAAARGSSLGRPHLAAALVQARHAADLAEAFRLWLVPGAPAYIEKQQLTTAEALEVIRGSGGVPVLAHPATLQLDSERLAKLVSALAEQGLSGLEAYWSRHTEGEVRYCEELARTYRLVVTGGSDFHGQNKPGIELGMAAGRRDLPMKLVDELEQRRP